MMICFNRAYSQSGQATPSWTLLFLFRFLIQRCPTAPRYRMTHSGGQAIASCCWLLSSPPPLLAMLDTQQPASQVVWHFYFLTPIDRCGDVSFCQNQSTKLNAFVTTVSLRPNFNRVVFLLGDWDWPFPSNFELQHLYDIIFIGTNCVYL